MPTTDRRRRRRGRRPGWVTALVAVVVLALVVVVGRAVLERGRSLLPPSCVVASGGVEVDLDPEQARHAALVGAVAVRRKLPVRAATIAMATAMQESKLRNLDHGDRDSLGLFQQRPSQGWGTAAQVSDPRYATETFYSHLVKVRDYRNRPLTEVAQAVQRSGFPDAYAKHEREAAVLAGAFMGRVPRAVTCTSGDDAPGAAPGTAGELAREVDDVFGVRATVSSAGFTVGTDSTEGAAAIAAWAVAHAPDRRIAGVTSQGWTWTAGSRAAWARGGDADARTTAVALRR